jgi:hypothetical protein
MVLIFIEILPHDLAIRQGDYGNFDKKTTK